MAKIGLNKYPEWRELLLNRYAEDVAEFLNRGTLRLPGQIPRPSKQAAKGTQARLRNLLSPALDDLTVGRIGSAAVQNLVSEINALKGWPYRFEQVAGKANDQNRPWERAPAIVDAVTAEQYYLGLIAELFDDSSPLKLLGRCVHCGQFFSTKRRAKFMPGHAVIAKNKKLRSENYFSRYYQKRRDQALAHARRLRKKGIRGHELVDKLSSIPGVKIGRTLLVRYGLWDDLDD